MDREPPLPLRGLQRRAQPLAQAQPERQPGPGLVPGLERRQVRQQGQPRGREPLPLESRRGWLLPPLQATLLPWVSHAHPGQTASPSHCLVLPLPPPLPLHPRPQLRPPLRQPPWARQPRSPAWWACRSDLWVRRSEKTQIELVSALANQMSVELQDWRSQPPACPQPLKTPDRTPHALTQQIQQVCRPAVGRRLRSRRARRRPCRGWQADRRPRGCGGGCPLLCALGAGQPGGPLPRLIRVLALQQRIDGPWQPIRSGRVAEPTHNPASEKLTSRKHTMMLQARNVCAVHAFMLHAPPSPPGGAAAARCASPTWAAAAPRHAPRRGGRPGRGIPRHAAPAQHPACPPACRHMVVGWAGDWYRWVERAECSSWSMQDVGDQGSQLSTTQKQRS